MPIGKACSNSSTLVVDSDLRPVPDGEVGELLVRGSTVMSGYWGEPEKNRRVLVRRASEGELEGIYFRTGDRVRVLEDGNLTFVTRADRQVKVRGHRIELEEIETALLSLDPVEEAAVFTVPDGEGSSAVRAAVVVGSRRSVVRNGRFWPGLRKILPAHSVPAEITVLESLPRTPTGKVNRNALRDHLAEKEGRMGTDNAAGLETQEIEARILEFVQRELLSPEVSVERDDELLSGELLDSIGVLRLATFVQEEFRFKMQPADFVIENFQTVAVLAEYVRRAAGQTPADHE